MTDSHSPKVRFPFVDGNSSFILLNSSLLLWQELRANKLGVHFRRQQIIAGFIVDFYCHKAALVIEVDGDIHDLQQEEDARREKVLKQMGLRIAVLGLSE